MARTFGPILLVCGLVLSCGKSVEFEVPVPNEPASASPVSPDKPTEDLKPGSETESSSDPSPATEVTSPEVKKSPEPTPEESPEAGGAVAPDEHPGFLSLDAISDNVEIQSLIASMAVSGNSKQKRKDLKSLRRKGSYRALKRALRAENPNIRIQSAQILRRLGLKSKAFTQALIIALRSDPDPDVRGKVAEVLVYYRNRTTVPALIEVLLHDTGDGARINAARALAAIKDARAVSPLIKALDDKDTWVRLRAAGALKRMGAKRAVPALVERLKDPNKRVQQRAHEALKTLTGKTMGPDFDAWRKAYPAR